MSVVACACLCNNSDRLIRDFLKQSDYPDWLALSIPQGKERSLALVKSLPNFPEKQDITTFLNNSSKWALIIGFNENGLRYADISHYNTKSRIDAKHIVDTFA